MPRPMNLKTATLLKDVVIPAGTRAIVEPPSGRQTYVEHVSVLVAHGPDHASEWLIALEDAVALGLVAPAAPAEE